MAFGGGENRSRPRRGKCLFPSSLATYPHDMIIDIVSDTICPWCFIGKRRFERALAERSPKDPITRHLQVGWRPFQLNPDMPQGGIDRKEYLALKFGGEDRATHVYDPIHDAGKAEGIPFAFGKISRTPNTVNSHRLVYKAAKTGQQPEIVEALFSAYFLEGRDVESPDSLSTIAAEAGMEKDAVRAYLESDEDADRIRAEDAMARQMGIRGVPCFIINRKYAISGAQEPAAFHQAFEIVARDESVEAKDGSDD